MWHPRPQRQRRRPGGEHGRLPLVRLARRQRIRRRDGGPLEDPRDHGIEVEDGREGLPGPRPAPPDGVRPTLVRPHAGDNEEPRVAAGDDRTAA